LEFYTSVRKLGKNILYRGIDEYGNRVCEKVEYSPTLYVEDNVGECIHKSMHKLPLKPIKFLNIPDANEFISSYDSIENFSIYGEKRYEYSFISELFKGNIHPDYSKVLIYKLDIETKLDLNEGFPYPAQCREEISLITITNSITKRVTTFGTFVYDNRDNVNFIYCINETQLLKHFLQFWVSSYPDIITGWFSKGFDIPYLYRRMVKVLGEKHAKRLSPFNWVNESVSVTDKGMEEFEYDIYGIDHIDYRDLYKKSIQDPRESYKLDEIAFIELGERKVENPYDTFKEFYVNDPSLFVSYNIQDTVLLDRLEDKLRLLGNIMFVAYKCKINFSDAMSPVRTWEILIYNHLLSKNIITPLGKSGAPVLDFAGGYVKHPVIGKHNWVVTWDVNSMHPHIIMNYNISPETMLNTPVKKFSIDDLLYKTVNLDNIDGIMSANGVQYSKEFEGILPELMSTFYAERQSIQAELKPMKKIDNPSSDILDKIRMMDVAQNGIKIGILNSGYGALGNKHFKYFDTRLAEAVTLGSQIAIRWVGTAINEYLNKVCKTVDEEYFIYADTDSNFLKFEKFVELYCQGMTDREISDTLSKVSEDKIIPLIEKKFNELAQYMKCNENRLKMSRENIAKSVFFRGARNYAMAVVDQEGKKYDPPKMKIAGLECVKSSTPKIAREYLKKCVELILLDSIESVREYEQSAKQDFYSKSVQEIALPRSVNGVEKYSDPTTLYKSRCPIAVRGAILHNYYVTKHNLQNKYQMINDGDKIKFAYLKLPNPIRENVISWNGKIPHEIILDNMFDYDIMYSKAFIGPLESMLDCVGWDLKHKFNILDFF
jgi:DNA polymerase elongation subunit (family B)